MKPVFNVAALLCIVLLGVAPHFGACTAPATDQAREFTKTIKKEYDITADGNVHLSNKYGKVEVKTWDKPRVKVEVTIVVNANSEAQAQEIFDRISIQFTNTTSMVKAETVIEPARRTWWWNWGNTSGDYKINYLVFMPPSCNLELYHRYGDAFVAELKNRALINIKYGNFKADGVGDRATVDLAYGNGTLTKAGYLQGAVAYGNLSCIELKDADLATKYSKINIERASIVRATSKYDEYKLGAVQEFRNTGNYDNFDIRSASTVYVNTRYSNLKLERLGQAIDLTMAYGSLVVQKVDRAFNQINLVGKYSDFKLNLEPGADARVEATGSYAGIGYPSSMTVSYEKEQGQSKEVRGHIGSVSGKGLIKAQLSYGNLKLRQE